MEKILARILKFILDIFAFLFGPIFLYFVDYARNRREESDSNRLKEMLQSCGRGCRFNGRAYISNPNRVAIGNNVHIGDNAYIKSKGGLTIGDNTHISRNVTIYTVNHNYHGGALPFDDIYNHKPVLIGKNVWIGMNVSITPGVTIGDGAIIGMGTLITEDVPSMAIVGGQSPRIVRKRDQIHYENLEKNNRFGGVMGKSIPEKERGEFFVNPYNNNGKSLFFILTTGRSGSMTIAHALNRHSQITCYHEPRGQLIRLSGQYAHGIKTHAEVRKELFAIYCNSSVFPLGIHGESDQKYWNLFPILSEIFSESKFIWLLRDGREVVCSTFARKWFDSNELEIDKHEMRLWRLDGAKCGFFSDEEWSSMSTFERNCWYWAYVNELIETQLSLLPVDRYMMIRLEDIQGEFEKIHSFLGLDPESQRVPQLNTATDNVINWDNWSSDEARIFNKWCGNFMERWYP